MKIIPAIHYLDGRTTHHQAALAQQSGADGVLVSGGASHFKDVLRACGETKHLFPALRVLIKVDGMNDVDLLNAAVDLSLDGLLLNTDILPLSLSADLSALSGFVKEHRQFSVYANIPPFFVLRPVGHIEREASKFSLRSSAHIAVTPNDADVFTAATLAQSAGFIPLIDWASTSGVASWDTASHRAERFIKLFEFLKGHVAMATGFTENNLFAYAPYFSHIVETNSTSMSAYAYDLDRVRSLIARSGLSSLPLMV